VWSLAGAMTAGILVLGYHHREIRVSKQHVGVLAPFTADRLRGRERPVFVSTPDPYLSYQDVGRLGRWGESWGPRMPILTSLSRANYRMFKRL
jgi:hypothetical protein